MPSAVILSDHSYPTLPLARQLVHQWIVHPGPLVLGATPLKYPTPTADRDRTVSRRSKPSSRTSLNGEQPYPWDLLQPQDEMSRHRGAKRCRRYGLLGTISLLSPAYLLAPIQIKHTNCVCSRSMVGLNPTLRRVGLQPTERASLLLDQIKPIGQLVPVN